jgi:hypothetical protein
MQSSSKVTLWETTGAVSVEVSHNPVFRAPQEDNDYFRIADDPPATQKTRRHFDLVSALPCDPELSIVSPIA